MTAFPTHVCALTPKHNHLHSEAPIRLRRHMPTHSHTHAHRQSSSMHTHGHGHKCIHTHSHEPLAALPLSQRPTLESSPGPHSKCVLRDRFGPQRSGREADVWPQQPTSHPSALRIGPPALGQGADCVWAQTQFILERPDREARMEIRIEIHHQPEPPQAILSLERNPGAQKSDRIGV